jgi:hypothetical protein
LGHRRDGVDEVLEIEREAVTDPDRFLVEPFLLLVESGLEI